MTDPYTVLGLDRTAEPEAVTAAYRALSRKWHPDVNPAGEERMKALTAAYSVLGNTDTRSAFDRAHPVPTTPRRAPGAAPQAPGCVHHFGVPATGSCSCCGAPMCAVCIGLRRRLGGEGRCPTCRARQLFVRLAVSVAALAAPLALWLIAGHLPLLLAGMLSYPVPAVASAVRLGALRPRSGVPVCAPSRESLSPSGGLCLVLTVLRAVGWLLLGLVVTPVEVAVTALLLAVEMRGAGVGLLMPNRFVGRWRAS